MTETEVPAAAAEPDPAHPFTETALARILLCEAYREVAEFALSRIPTDGDGSDFTAPGDVVRAAADLLTHAEEVMRRAAVYERERGTSWDEIGEALGITKQSAHKRFAGAVENWRAPFDRPARLLPDGTPDDERIPYGARYAPGAPDPQYGTAEDHAQQLERWLLQHTGPADHWHGDEHPVTGSLPRYTTTSMLVLTERISHRLLHDQLVPDPQAQADVCDRRAGLYERLLREDTAVPAEIHQWIEKDRARAAALRQTAGHGTPWPAVASTPGAGWLEEALRRTIARLPELPGLAHARAVAHVSDTFLLEVDTATRQALDEDGGLRQHLADVLEEEAAPGPRIKAVRLVQAEEAV